MGSMTITGLNNEKYTVTSTDNKIDAGEIKQTGGNDNAADLAMIQTLLEGASFTDGQTWSLEDVVKNVGGVTVPKKGDKDYDAKVKLLKEKLEALANAKAKLETKKAELEKQLKDPVNKAAAKQRPIKDQISAIESAISTADTFLKQLTQQAKAIADADPEAKAILKDAIAAGKGAEASDSEFGSAKFAFSSSTGGAQQSNGAPQGGKAGGVAPGFAPAGPGAFGMPGGGTGFKAAFDPSAWYQSSMFMDAKLAALDDVGAQQLQSQKMLMLFFYFAKMAMSGDMGAMFQFIRFIGVLINRDKATQNIALAEKLIQLQDASRKASDQLLKQDAYAPDDPQVGADFNKLMERTKADQGMIATDQKLIAQMLEEMSQVSEMFTGMVKSVQDSYGRQLQIVSQWRA